MHAMFFVIKWSRLPIRAVTELGDQLVVPRSHRQKNDFYSAFVQAFFHELAENVPPALKNVLSLLPEVFLVFIKGAIQGIQSQ